MTVRGATPDDVHAIGRISVAAGERFRTIDEPRIARCADDPPMSVDDVRAYVDDGRAIVAVDAGGVVVGFLLIDVLPAEPAVESEVAGPRFDCKFAPAAAHVEEVSVHPDAQGGGHGTALLDAVADWAVAQGLAAVTLTTFRDVPWNAPFYERRGFRVLAEDDPELTDALRAKVADEAAHGLDPDLRVVMRRTLTP